MDHTKLASDTLTSERLTQYYNNHNFSENEITLLEALGDTFIPAIDDHRIQSFNGDLQSYYQLSASELGAANFAAGLICSKLKPEVQRVLKWVLWLLSGRLGTFVVCGRGSLSAKFPFFPRSFQEIPAAERAQLLLSAWSHSSSELFRSVFNVLKIFTAYSYFTKLDKNGRNPTWNALGYCGPDPVAVYERINAAGADQYHRKPLQGSVFDAEILRDQLPAMLNVKLGFEELKDIAHLQSLCSKSDQKRLGKIGDRAVGIKCDAVVVGSGCGGGMAAAVLSKAGYKVLVLEKGKYYARDDLSLLEGPSLDGMYENGGLLTTDTGNILLLAGATVGGGTAVNWSASIRTPAHVLDEWAQDRGLDMFRPGAEYERAMEVVTARLGVQTGEQHNWQNRILMSGCEKLGYQVGAVARNTPPDHDCGWCCFGCWNGKKQATSETWLVDAAAAGAAVVAGVEAEAVLQRSSSTGKKQAAGVVARIGGDLLLYIESKITVVSTGALNTPVLLQKSGIKNPHIGKHLYLHPVQIFWGYFGEGEENSYEGAIITAMSTHAAHFDAPRGHGCILQVPTFHPGLFSTLVPWVSPADFKERMARFSRTAHVFALARDHGSATVTWDGKQRVIASPLLAEDEAALVEGGDAAIRVLIAAGAVEVGSQHRSGDRIAITPETSENEVEEFLRRVRQRGVGKLGTPLASAHQMGSCRMGVDAGSSVVGPDGQSWDVSGLFVCDGSILPTALGVNPMITIQSLAYCVAHSGLKYVADKTI